MADDRPPISNVRPGPGQPIHPFLDKDLPDLPDGWIMVQAIKRIQGSKLEAGDVAAFPKDVARRLIEGEAAVPYDMKTKRPIPVTRTRVREEITWGEGADPDLDAVNGPRPDAELRESKKVSETEDPDFDL